MTTDWDLYRFFIAVSETGSLSAAARRLETSQPRVGRKISALENYLGARLFNRLPDRYVLSDVGEAILNQTKQIETNIHDMKRVAKKWDQRHTGEVTLTTTESLATCWLNDKLPLLKMRYPEIVIQLAASPTLHDLARQEADIALRIGNPGGLDLVGRRISAVQYGLFASQSYLEENGTPSEPEDLDGHVVIATNGPIADFTQNQLLRNLASNAAIGLHCNSTLAGFAAMRAGVGLFPLPTYMVGGIPEIMRVLREDFDVVLDLWLLVHRDLKDVARIRAVLNFLADEIHADQELFSGCAR